LAADTGTGNGSGAWAPVGADGPGRARVAEIQRSRLLAAAVGVLDEHGYAGTTVALIATRARVSRRTFYELFGNREECLAAVFQEIVALVEAELRAAGLEGLAWQERVRGGLWTLLSFFEREPLLARVCVVHALRGDGAMLERREQVLARLVAAVDEGRETGAAGAADRRSARTQLTAEGVVGAALAILYARLTRTESEPLTELLGELCGMIVLPYLGAAAARREQTRALPASPPEQPGGAREQLPRGGDPLRDVPMRMTYRTARVLEGVGEHPGCSNRQVADFAGIGDQGQVSKLLARLQRLGLIANHADPTSSPRGEGGAGAKAKAGRGGPVKGEPNAWTLTLTGERVQQSIHMHAATGRRAA
jgi:AcrR family transcriptional regulator